MSNRDDFSWAEVGARIRSWRQRRGISQQALADATGFTQNGIFRLERGQTNPQLATLKQIASALHCSARELVTGAAEADPGLGGRLTRLKRVIDSGDEAALRAMDNGLETAEALLERVGGQRRPPLLKRKLLTKGEGRESESDELLWMQSRAAVTLDKNKKLDQAKMRRTDPGRAPDTTHATKNKY